MRGLYYTHKSQVKQYIFYSNAVLFHISAFYFFGRRNWFEFLRMVICSALFFRSSLPYIQHLYNSVLYTNVLCKGFFFSNITDGMKVIYYLMKLNGKHTKTRFLLFACFYNLLYNRVSAFRVYSNFHFRRFPGYFRNEHEIVKYTCPNKFSIAAQHQ